MVAAPVGGTLFRVDGFTIRNGSVGVSCLNSSPSISNNTITGNSSYGISCSSSSATVTNNEILGNGGCGIFCFSSSSGTVMNNAIWGNTGGGIYVYQSSPLIADNTIIGNSAISLPNPGSNSAYCCGGISCSQGRWSIVNNTIVGNSAPSGGGIFIYYDYGSTIANNIVAFNSSGLFNYGGGSGPAVLNSNCVYGNTDYDYWSPGAPPGGSGNISVDPLLVDVHGGNFHIQQDSPCRDAGDIAYVQAGWVDMDGQPRIYDGTVDIGADEWYPSGPVTMTLSLSSTTATARQSVTATAYAPGATSVNLSFSVPLCIPSISMTSAGNDTWTAPFNTSLLAATTAVSYK